MGTKTMIWSEFRRIHRLFIDPEKRIFKKKLDPVTVAVAADVLAPAV